MAVPSTSVGEGQAPSRASLERPIDLVHLSRMTLGDRGLEREVLALFDRQATVLAAGEGDLSAAITRLAAVAEEARAVIAELLRTN